MEKVFFVTLGCPKNRVDSEIMLGYLIEANYEIVGEPEEADILVVNTCGFIQDAKKESIQTILEMIEHKKEGSNKKVVVTGCMAQLYQEELVKELPEVDYFIGTGVFQEIVPFLKSNKKSFFGKPHYLQNENTPRVNTLPSHTAYIKIAEGCSNSCSFCIIPKIKGAQTSRTIENILHEVQNIVENNGVKEINLVAQELTAYGKDLPEKPTLVELLKELVKVENLQWIRLFYNYPTGFDDQLIDLIASEPKIVPYIDLPLQHISDNVLKMMFRANRENTIHSLIQKIREKIPQAAIRASFIVGFPGETEEDFKKLLDFVEETKFEHLGVFAYSKEENTEAAKMSNQIPQKIKKRRQSELMRLQKKISNSIMKGYVGQTLDVIIDGLSEESDLLLVGRHKKQGYDVDGVIYINDGTANAGDIVKVKITDSGDYDLVGGIVEEEE